VTPLGPRAPSSSYDRIYAVVRRIPRGRVSTYGEVARAARLGAAARQVGYALHALPEESDVPWQRVVNARGEISARASGFEVPQRRLLEHEGVRFDARGRIDLARFGWRPPAAPAGRPPAAPAGRPPAAPAGRRAAKRSR
jgi:methylated-DNA-protein-cysteine methyltransferase-like protein